MRKIYNIIALATSAIIVSTICLQNHIFDEKTYQKVFTHNQIQEIFPKTCKEITDLVAQCYQETVRNLDKIIKIPNEQRTFHNTIQAYDTVKNNFLNVSRTVYSIFMVSPDQQLRTYAQQQALVMDNYEVELFEQNVALYTAINSYVTTNHLHEKLTDDENYFLELIIRNFKNAGVTLSSEQRTKLIELKKEFSNLSAKFQNTISKTNKTILIAPEELAGVPENLLQSLQKTSDGNYLLTDDYITYITIMTTCSISQTRKKLYIFYTNRTYPENMDVLKNMIICKNKIAEILGYKSAAHLALDGTMAQTPEHVEEFLMELSAKTNLLEQQEFETLVENLPSSITRSPDGKLYPWDRTYLMEQYKKNHYRTNEQLIAAYFSLETTVDKMLKLFEKFFDLTFDRKPLKGLWDPNLHLITIYHHKTVVGYLVLDLFYRANKYHTSCHTSIITSQRLKDGTIKPGVSLLLTLFSNPGNQQSALLSHNDVSTLFHEFGHSLHALLGAAQFATLSGVQVKRDFVETPSQMLEEWVWDKEILKQMSSHYQTGEPLPDHLITDILSGKNMYGATNAQAQLVYSLMALRFFRDGAHKDLHSIFKEIYQTVKPHDAFCEDTHSYLSFNQFISYDAKYYTYVWSKVFALDLFEEIRKRGLCDPLVGIQLKELIFAPGGSKDPNELLCNFLGRKPSIDAYMQTI